jgi:hypothetical protein
LGSSREHCVSGLASSPITWESNIHFPGFTRDDATYTRIVANTYTIFDSSSFSSFDRTYVFEFDSPISATGLAIDYAPDHNCYTQWEIVAELVQSD